MTIAWKPISEAKTDGTEYLLWYPAKRDVGIDGRGLTQGGAMQGWWFSSPKQIGDGWETVIGFIGEPTHFAEMNEPANGFMTYEGNICVPLKNETIEHLVEQRVSSALEKLLYQD